MLKNSEGPTTNDEVDIPEGEPPRRNMPDTGPFDKPELMNRYMLRHTEYLDDVIAIVDKAHIYASAKRAVITVASNYFSSPWFLANFEKGGRGSTSHVDELQIAKLGLELDFLIATCSFCPSDNKSPDMLNIRQAIQSQFRAIISRTWGSQREGVANRKDTVAQEITETRYQAPLPPQPQQQKKPFLSLFGGK